MRNTIKCIDGDTAPQKLKSDNTHSFPQNKYYHNYSQDKFFTKSTAHFFQIKGTNSIMETIDSFWSSNKNKDYRVFYEYIKGYEHSILNIVITTYEIIDKLSDKYDVKFKEFYGYDEKITDKNYRMHYNKANALAYLESSKNKNLKLFCDDKNTNSLEGKGEGAKWFITTTYELVYHISTHYRAHFYEYCQYINKVKLQIDIDIKKDTEGNRDKKLKKVVKKIVKYLDNKIFPQFDIKDYSYIVLKSENNEGKISGHIVFTNVVFDNVLCMKYLLEDNPDKLIDKKILDDSIYKVSCFRNYLSSKIGKKNKLVYFKSHNYEVKDDYTLFLDTLICNVSSDIKSFNYESKNVEKKIINSKINKLYDKEYKDVKITINDSHTVDYIKQRLDLINTTRSDDYKDWTLIGRAMFNSNNSNECFVLWDDWSKNSPKYKMGECAGLWKSWYKTYYSANSGLLNYYARKDNEAKYLALSNCGNKSMFKKVIIDKKEIEVYQDNSKFNKIFINQKYIMPTMIVHIDAWIDNSKTIAIQSQWGTGKTCMLGNIIEKYDHKRILFISYRQAFTNDVYGEFKKYHFGSYLNGEFHFDRLICQLESLHKLLIADRINSTIIVPKYDLVILDEIESLIYHFESSTIVNKKLTFNIFDAICKGAKKIIALDSDFSDRGYDYLKNVNDQVNVIQNLYVSNKKHFKFTNDSTKIMSLMSEDIKKKRNIFIIAMSATMGEYYYEEFKKQKIKVVFHSSKSDDKLKNELIDVNNFWIQYQVVIITPTIEAGVNFWKKHFHKMYIVLCDKSASPRGLLQMCNRVRELEDTNIDVLLNRLPYKETTNFYTYEEVECLFENIVVNGDDDMQLNSDGNFVIKNDIYKKMCIYNCVETLNKGTFYFVPYLISLLKQKSYTYDFDDTKYKKDNINKTEIIIDKLLETQDINKKEYNELIDKQVSNKATEEDKLKIKKYEFKDIWNVKKLDKEFLAKNYKKHDSLINYKMLCGEIDCNDDFKNKKIKVINELINMLGFTDVEDDKKILKNDFLKNRDKVEKKSKLFTDKNVMTLFEFNKSKITSIKSFMGSMNSLFGDYGFKIKSIKQGDSKHRKNYYCIFKQF